MELLLTRRQTLQSLAAAAVFSTGAGATLFGLAGCGGGGVGGGGGGGGIAFGPEWAVGTVEGRVDLSAGLLKEAKSVATPFATAPLGPDGAFKILGYAASLAPALVLDGAGKPLAVAFIRPNEAEITLRRVAQTLTYATLKAWLLLPEGREPAFDAFGRSSAVEAIASGLMGLSGTLEANAEAVRALLRSNIAPLLLNGGAPGDPGGRGRGIRVDPSNGKSGVTVLQQGLDEITLQNTIRRRTYVYIDRVRTTNEAGVETPLNERVKEFPLGSVNNPTSIGGYVADIGDLLGSGSVGSSEFTGNIAWVPNELGPYTVPLAPSDAKETRYRVVVVGPARAEPAPPGLPDDVVAEGPDILLESFTLDIALPAFFALIGPVVEKITGILGGPPSPEEQRLLKDFGVAISALKDAIGLALTQPNVEAKLDVGDYAGAETDVQNAILLSDAYSKLTTKVTELALAAAVRRAGYGSLSAAQKAAIAAFVEGIENVFKLADLSLLGLDYGAVFSAWESSRRYEVFNVDVTRSKVVLKPAFGTLPTKSSIPLSASVPSAAGEGGPLVTYKWKVSGVPGVTIRSKTTEGTEITSSTGDVELVSATGDYGVAAVTVEAIRNESGTANDVSLGKAEGFYNVTIMKLKVTPETAKLRKGATLAIAATIDDEQANSKYLLKWTVAGGTLDVGPDLTNRRTATFTAPDAKGDAKVTVELFQQADSGRVGLGIAAAQITVGDEEGPYTLESFVVDDNVTVWFNGNVLFIDAAGAFSGRRGPFVLTNAKAGDTLRIQVRDYHGLYAGTSDIVLTKPDGTRKTLVSAFQVQTPGGNRQIVLDKTFTLD